MIPLAHKVNWTRRDRCLNRAHVLLRNTGELASIDLVTGAVTLRAACTTPRGITFDAHEGRRSCRVPTGELLTFATAGGADLALEPGP